MLQVFFVKGNDYRIHFWYMNKDEALNRMNNTNLREESRLLRYKKTFHIKKETRKDCKKIIKNQQSLS